MSLIDVHARLGSTAMYYVLIMSLWGFWRYFRKQGVEGSYWGALVIGEILLLAQAVLGLVIWMSGAGALPGMHLLYGVVSVMIIPAAFLYTRGDEKRRAMLIYGAGLLFLVGILLRAIDTAA